MDLFNFLVVIIALISPVSVGGGHAIEGMYGSQGTTVGGDDELLSRIWDGVQAAQRKYLTGCGKITEVRTSKLLARPLTFRGKFCAAGTEDFALEYFEPEPIRLVFNRDYLNVTTGRERKTTEVIEVGHHVRKTQAYFSRANSLKNLQENFSIAVRQSTSGYVMKLVPRSGRFRQRVNYVVVELAKDDFLLRTLEVDGAGGVRSIFKIDLESLNQRLDEGVFKIYRPKQ